MYKEEKKQFDNLLKMLSRLIGNPIIDLCISFQSYRDVGAILSPDALPEPGNIFFYLHNPYLLIDPHFPTICSYFSESSEFHLGPL